MDTRRVDLVVAQADGAEDVGHPPVVSRIDSVLKIRPGTMEDLAWVDELQKANSRAVGFLQRKALEGKVRLGQVLVATVMNRRAGYLIAADRYLRRDELGLITQVNVEPAYRRSLVAAALVQAQFDRSAYGCKLYACWCAQDLEANRFWEALGFVPIAFRSGAKGKGSAEAGGRDQSRIHLFWQKRIRPGDEGPGATPWWYPCKTEGGQMRADRIAFPVPPGVHWSEVKAVDVPEVEVAIEDADPEQQDASPDRQEGEPVVAADKVVYPRGIEHRDGQLWKGGKRLMTIAMIKAEQGVGDSGMWFLPADVEVVASLPEPTVVKAKRPRAKKPRTAKAKVKRTVDPKVVELSRELRDRWLEEVEYDPSLVALPSAKHDVRRLPKRRPTRPLALPSVERKALPMAA